jgi:ABC-type multidrug transport system fused ATPase/permease subunit
MRALYDFLRQCATIIGGRPRRLLVLVFYFVLVAMLELIGLSLIVPFLTALVAPNLVTNVPLLNLISTTMSPSSTHMLLILGIVITLIFLTKSVVSIVVQSAIYRFSFGERGRLQRTLLNHYQLLPYQFHLQRNSAELIHSITQLVPTFIRDVLTPGLKLLAEGIVALAILALLMNRAPIAVLGIAVALSSIAFLNDRFLRHRFATLGVVSNRAHAQLIMAINHVIGGYKEITVLGCQEYYQSIGHRSVMEGTDADAHFYTLSVLSRQMLEMVVLIFMVIFTLVESFRGVPGSELLATLALFGIAAARMIPTMNYFLSTIQLMRFRRDTVRRLYADLQAYDQYNWTNQKKDGITINTDTVDVFESLELRNVSFQYLKARAPVLHNVNLTLRSGDALGIIGPSGAGKSTLVDVILGFLPPKEGEVLFNGHRFGDNPRRWLNHVAYLPQIVFLSDDSLRRNVALGISENEIDDDRVMLALHQASLETLVTDLPGGLDTLVGERGIRLSGGQRQRVALARAFYHNREVLILDEATSALDNETEREIVEQIKRLHRLKTMIVIAHRLSTVVNCDRVIKLNNGQICEQKTLKE